MPRDINEMQIPGQTTVVFLFCTPPGKYGQALHLQGLPSSSISDWPQGKGKGKIRVEATRNYCSNLALAGICKPPLSR